jgi:hypothetical protein
LTLLAAILSPTVIRILDEGGPTDDLSKSSEVREILPWLELSAELDPERHQEPTSSPRFGCKQN